ncbi:hypothetical protein LJC55_03905 [Eubacteriales bacterium OttesenSCG-928-N14]|nr:hypothetical protein [Eubacteriales bacterium OttesenSCG-928-N14]
MSETKSKHALFNAITPCFAGYNCIITQRCISGVAFEDITKGCVQKTLRICQWALAQEGNAGALLPVSGCCKRLRAKGFANLPMGACPRKECWRTIACFGVLQKAACKSLCEFANGACPRRECWRTIACFGVLQKAVYKVFANLPMGACPFCRSL